MIVKKKQTAVKASEMQPSTQEKFAPVDTVIQGECPYTCARTYIENAIKELTKVAETDQIAKESIANLAVVMLDLTDSCNN